MPSTWTVHGPVPYLEQFEVFRRSRLVLNLDPNWSHGVHDRVFNAMSVGTPALTNDNAWASSCLDDGHDSLLFTDAQGAVAQLLSHRGRTEAMANAAVKTLGRGLHRWRDRCALFDQLNEDRRN
jgi:spore maturation protein CgeB